MQSSDYALMTVYLLAVTAFGVVASRRKSDTEGYLLAGGRIPFWASGISYLMALLSTASLVAIPGEAYANGLRYYLIDWIGLVPATVFFLLFMRFYFMAKTFTPFQYLERRFDFRVRAIGSTIYLLTRVTYISVVLFSCAIIFQGTSGWEPWISILLLGAFSTGVCLLGGQGAVVWTNVLQFFVMIGGLLVVLVTCVEQTDGGALSVITYAFEHDHGFRLSSLDSDFFSFDPRVRMTFWLLIVSSILQYMFYNSADQIAVQQLLTTSSYREAKKSYFMSIFLWLPIGALIWFVGLAVFKYFSLNPLPGGNPPPDQALSRFIALNMPSPAPGIFVAAMLSAAISTLTAGLTSISTVVTKDVYFRFLRTSASDAQQVRFSRWMILLLGATGTAASVAMAYSSKALGETLIEATAIWMAAQAVVAPTFLVGVLSTKATARQMLGAIVAGLLATAAMVAWYVSTKGTPNAPSFMVLSVPGAVLTVLLGMVLPYFSRKRASASQLGGLTIWTQHQETAAEYEVTR